MKPRTAFLAMLLAAMLLVASRPASATGDADVALALSHEVVHATRILPLLPGVPLASAQARARAAAFEAKLGNDQAWRLLGLPGQSYLIYFWDDTIPVGSRMRVMHPESGGGLLPSR